MKINSIKLKHFKRFTDLTRERALKLAGTNLQGFEGWCVTHVLKFESNAKKVADGGIEGKFQVPNRKVRGKQTYGKAVLI